MKSKPRGSTSGLEDYHNKLRTTNTALMMEVVARLRIERPHSKWSYSQVWSGAGLKSKIALDSVWNKHIRLEIDHHNEKIVSDSALHHQTIELAANKPIIQNLKKQIQLLKQQRDQALALIAQYAADADYYKRRSADLQKTVDRLKSHLNTERESNSLANRGRLG